MNRFEPSWDEVDAYLSGTLVPEDDALSAARATGRRSTMPGAEVAPNQGAFLALLVRIAGARRILEFGTLAGYSTIWLARAAGPDGHVTSLEIDEGNAALARANLARADLDRRVEVLVGPAADSVRRLVAAGGEPYDFVFIDADKPRNPVYLAAALELTAPGAVIVVDNVVRGGAVADPAAGDERVRGVRALLAEVARDDRLEATALQTVGAKGWDGFTLIRRTA